MDRFAEPAALVTVLDDWTARPGPLYRRLAASIGRAITAGELPPGTRLPAERSLAKALAVSRATVVSAFDELRSRGLVVSRQGSGTRVSADAAARTSADSRADRGRARPIMQRFAAPPTDVISMAYAVDPGDPLLAETLVDVAYEDLPELLTDVGYHPRGLLALRAAIAEHYTDLGLRTVPEQVLVTTGAHQAIALAARLYVHEGSTIAVESPSWPGCFDVYDTVGARLVGVPLDDEGVRPDLLAATLAEHRPAMLFVIPTFHNPTGVLMSRSRRRQVAELAARHRVPVLEDNAYGAPTRLAELPPPVAAFAPADAQVLTVGSLSKVLWGGLRIGWVRGPVDVIDRLTRHKALADLGSPLIDQAVAARLLPRLPELAASRAAPALRRLRHLEQLLRDALPTWRWQEPDGGTALWIDTGEDATRLAQRALRHGVEVVPGSATDPTGTHNTHIRLPYTYPPEVLNQAVTRLTQATTG